MKDFSLSPLPLSPPLSLSLLSGRPPTSSLEGVSDSSPPSFLPCGVFVCVGQRRRRHQGGGRAGPLAGRYTHVLRRKKKNTIFCSSYFLLKHFDPFLLLSFRLLLLPKLTLVSLLLSPWQALGALLLLSSTLFCRLALRSPHQENLLLYCLLAAPAVPAFPLPTSREKKSS